MWIQRTWVAIIILSGSPCGWRAAASSQALPTLNHYASLLRERGKAIEAVIMSHSAGTDSAEWQVVLTQMKDAIIYGHTTGQSSPEHLVCAGRILIEVIKRQRPRTGVHERK